MTLTPSQREILVRLEIQKSEVNFEQAQLASKHKYWDLVANRLYYSVFHAISALLIKNGIPVKSHKGAILMFNLHFVKNNLIDIEFARTVSFLQSKREEADYNCFSNISEEMINPQITKTEVMITCIKKLIDK